MPVARQDDRFGLPDGVDVTHPRLRRGHGLARSAGNGSPEAESLMNGKGMRDFTETMSRD